MTLSGHIYSCRAGESFDLVALNVYGDEKYAPELICANPKCAHLMYFAGGEKLNLPVVEVREDNSETEYASAVAPWKGGD